MLCGTVVQHSAQWGYGPFRALTLVVGMEASPLELLDGLEVFSTGGRQPGAFLLRIPKHLVPLFRES